MSRPVLTAVLLVLLAAPAARAEDVTPPLIRHTPLTKATKGESVTITASMEDESEIFAPTLYFRYPGAKGYSSLAMSRKGDAHVATVQATADVEYWIEAYDEFGNGPTREGSPDRPHRIVVAERPGAARASAAPRAAPTPRPAPHPDPEAVPPPPEPEPEPEAAAAPAPEPAPAAATTDVVPLLEEEPSTPIYKQWWLYAGGGVVAAALVVGIVVAAQPEPVHKDVFAASVSRP